MVYLAKYSMIVCNSIAMQPEQMALEDLDFDKFFRLAQIWVPGTTHVLKFLSQTSLSEILLTWPLWPDNICTEEGLIYLSPYY